jgi:hypothetical protein
VNLILAEMADKMETVPQLWLFQGLLSVPFLVGAFLVRGKAGSLVTVCLAGGFSAIIAYGEATEAFGQSSYSQAIRREMGGEWIAHSIASPFLPLVLTAVVVSLRRPWIKRDPR